MGLKELAKDALYEEGDFEVYGLYGTHSVVNDIAYTCGSEKIREEHFRHNGKARFSLKIDGEEIPFATAKKEKGLFWGKYKANVHILPCMVPQAIEALGLYIRDKNLSPDSLSKIHAVQKELYDILTAESNGESFSVSWATDTASYKEMLRSAEEKERRSYSIKKGFWERFGEIFAWDPINE
jgi:hypothetical protein